MSTNSSNNFIELNGLMKSPGGVYLRDSAQPFDYSDGEEVEQRLATILAAANDLSSDSKELEAHISDWPSEYHLSSTRANLLRPLQLEGVTRVLELGCGCGAISRYLGEQSNIQVDAVEGSATRAQLAATRCRDLPNVQVSHGNFNELEFPAAHYDLVLFVGVTEYAGRFSTKATDQEALQDLLALAKSACKPDGIVLIAIENRLGLKYLMGACEDHYGVPDIGLRDYPESTGIRTYSRAQWEAEIGRSKFSAAHFIYPFPDYKVPTLLINQHATHTSGAIKSLRKVQSRDYLRPFDMSGREAELWANLASNGNLSDFSNSFVILLGDSQQRIKALADFDVQEFENERYDWQSTATPAQAAESVSDTVSAQAANIARLQRRLGEVQEECEQLRAKLELLENSRRHRLFNWFRR